MAVTLTFGTPAFAAPAKELVALLAVQQIVMAAGEKAMASSKKIAELKEDGKFFSKETYQQLASQGFYGSAVTAKEIMQLCMKIDKAVQDELGTETEVREVRVFGRMYCGENESEHAVDAKLDLNRLQQVRQVVQATKSSAMMFSGEKGAHFDMQSMEWAMHYLTTEEGEKSEVLGVVGSELLQNAVDGMYDPDPAATPDVEVKGQRLMISAKGVWFEGYIPDKHMPETVESELITFEDMEHWWSTYGAAKAL